MLTAKRIKLMTIDDLLLAGVDFNKPWTEWLNQALKIQAKTSFKAGECNANSKKG